MTSCFHNLLAVPCASLNPTLAILVCAAGGGRSCRKKQKELSITVEIRSETLSGIQVGCTTA